VSSFLPVLRLGLVNPEGYIAVSLFLTPLGYYYCVRNQAEVAVAVDFLLFMADFFS
jgi:hypothetical protein